jgi:hypothetical protein
MFRHCESRTRSVSAAFAGAPGIARRVNAQISGLAWPRTRRLPRSLSDLATRAYCAGNVTVTCWRLALNEVGGG